MAGVLKLCQFCFCKNRHLQALGQQHWQCWCRVIRAKSEAANREHPVVRICPGDWRQTQQCLCWGLGICIGLRLEVLRNLREENLQGGMGKGWRTVKQDCEEVTETTDRLDYSFLTGVWIHPTWRQVGQVHPTQSSEGVTWKYIGTDSWVSDHIYGPLKRG